MAVLKIVKYPDKILKQKLSPVENFNSDLRDIVRDMFETMYTYHGIGLAANQVGIDRRIVVVDTSSTEKGVFTPLALINPEILNYSKRKNIAEEGCLSFPGYYDKIIRPVSIEVVYYDINGKKHQIIVEGLLARVLQHEIDHINGVKFIQRMTIEKQIKFYLLYKLGKCKF
ncbi:MAG: peptide deformylase [Endomicrobia bacterium]|nr:peptide deformylase [Endomicrobiia bacterium]